MKRKEINEKRMKKRKGPHPLKDGQKLKSAIISWLDWIKRPVDCVIIVL